METKTASNTIWPCVNYRDAHAAIDFLQKALGFTAAAVHEGGPERPVAHAELRLPDGAGIMLGSASDEGNEFERKPTGAARSTS